jgi:hypothetical protein
MSSSQVAKEREAALAIGDSNDLYLSEYVSMSGYQNFLNATQNYPVLKGQKTNLYKCFIPQSWMIANNYGYSALIHENGIFNDSKGNLFRKEIYIKLSQHYRFINELLLFNGIDHHKEYSLNIYNNKSKVIDFKMIVNLFTPITIDSCYSSIGAGSSEGIKDNQNNWSIKGHKDRIILITSEEIKIIAKFFNLTEDHHGIFLPSIHNIDFLKIIKKLSASKTYIKENIIFYTTMFDETKLQKNGYLIPNNKFTNDLYELIYSGPYFNLSNPLYQTPSNNYKSNSDYNIIDVTTIPSDYLPRTNLSPKFIDKDYFSQCPKLNNNDQYLDFYRLFIRRRLDSSQQRTLNSAIIPPKIAHIDSIYGFVFNSIENLLLSTGLCSSILVDFIAKIFQKENFALDHFKIFPNINESFYINSICLRVLKLNCLTIYYNDLVQLANKNYFNNQNWSKNDHRLNSKHLSFWSDSWTYDFPLRTDYERRQALVEIDVLTAMALNLTLKDLLMIYHIHFPVLLNNENNTWYDINGRIVFTNNKSFKNVGFSSVEWDKIKDAPSGVFTRTITDDTLPGGPIERTIEYLAPFDRCDREKDYESAWNFFKDKADN